MKPESMKLPVSETFYSIQGEGATMGVCAVFLRLGGCNLLCKSDSWICDTIEVWKKSKSTEFKDVLSDEFIDKLRNGAHLVITGGEPMLHQHQLNQYIYWFMRNYEFKPVIEIETNGTIIPIGHFHTFVDFWNVSPKLSTTGLQNKKNVRINENAIKFFDSESKKTTFKFVVSSENDVIEIYKDFAKLINDDKIMLMPAGSTREELDHMRLFVIEKCKQLNVRYSERLHIVAWNKKTGV